MTLKTYSKKRDFKKTPEPSGKISLKKKKTRLFVVQKHRASHLHYDFRLELGGVLLSWAVPKKPSQNLKVKRLAVHVENHPVAYASFEGEIPEGEYGAGTVEIWDKGTWNCVGSYPKKSYDAGDMTLILNGQKLKGAWKLIRLKNNDKNWLLFKIKDKPEYFFVLKTKNKKK